MSAVGALLRERTRSPALRRLRPATVAMPVAELRRRMAWIWGLLFLNVLPYGKDTVLPLPSAGGKVITQGALGAALLLIVLLNRRVLVRPNVFLVLMTILVVTSLMMSVRGYFGVGSVFRAVRFGAFVGALWMLTPWWGRNDLLLLRCHRRALSVILAVVVLGVLVSPGVAFGQGGGHRLGGALWPMQPTQVAHYAAVLAGTTIVLWFAGLIGPRAAALGTVVGVTAMLLTHTRTALVAFTVAVAISGLSLLLTRRRVRKVSGVAIVVAAIVAASFAPFLVRWFYRGETTRGFNDLTGRQPVWAALVAQPRPEVNTLFGYGMSNDSFNGLPIDSGWLSVYLDQGLVGDALVAAQFVVLLFLAAFHPSRPRRALALFLIVYVLLASVTETGIGQPNSYVLDLAVAASLLLPPAGGEPELTRYAEPAASRELLPGAGY